MLLFIHGVEDREFFSSEYVYFYEFFVPQKIDYFLSVKKMGQMKTEFGFFHCDQPNDTTFLTCEDRNYNAAKKNLLVLHVKQTLRSY